MFCDGSAVQDSDLPPGIPGWRRAFCLGCDGRIIANRDAYVTFSGSRDGAVLIVVGAEPQRMFATQPEADARPEKYLLGVAHRGCVDQARNRLEAGEVTLPGSLPTLEVGPDPGEAGCLGLRPAADSCPFCGDCEEMSDEDVYPKWVSKHFARHYGGFSVGTPFGQRATATLKITAPIGRACNNTWLSVLENDVKAVMTPMIDGPEPGEPPCRTLTPAQQRLLATWAVKTALMFDLHAGPGGQWPCVK